MIDRAPAFLLSLVATAAVAVAAAAEADATRTRARYVMGTVLSIRASADDATKLDAGLNAAFAAVQRLDELLSTFRPDSEVSRLNRQPPGRPLHVSSECIEILLAAVDCCRDTLGGFDVTVGPVVDLWRVAERRQQVPADDETAAVMRVVGMEHLSIDAERHCVARDHSRVRVDLGGIGKGYALDTAARALRNAGVTSATLDFGGAIYRLAPPRNGFALPVAIAAPWEATASPTTIALASGAVSTSADYERGRVIDGVRYSHIIDPRCGHPARGLSAVVVVDPSATRADALSTGLFALGWQTARKQALALKLAAMLVSTNGARFRTPQFRRLELTQEAT